MAEPSLNPIPRRTFLKWGISLLNALLAAVLAVPGLGYLLTPVLRKSQSGWIRLGPVADFTGPDPQKATFTYISEAGYTRSEKQGFVWVEAGAQPDSLTVFSAVCTHMGCNVAWVPQEGQFVCPCHGGRYNRDGEVVAGPPPRPLTRLPVRIENDELLIQLPS